MKTFMATKVSVDESKATPFCSRYAATGSPCERPAEYCPLTTHSSTSFPLSRRSACRTFTFSSRTASAALDPPASMAADAVRDEKVKVLQALRRLRGNEVDECVVRGQYSAGLSHGEPVAAYREQKGVALDSSTETFVAMKVFIDTWRWAGVPFYLRTGKRLSRRATEIALQFKHPPLPLFQGPAASVVKPNVLAMNIQPNEGITLSFGSKVPGPQLQVNPVRMDFRYGTSFGIPTTEAYARLLLDSSLGDSTLFARSDGVEEAWSFVDGIVSRWSEEDVGEPAFYEAGGWGPEEAEEMMDRDGREWRRL